MSHAGRSVEAAQAVFARLVESHNAQPLDETDGGFHLKECILTELLDGDRPAEPRTWCCYSIPHWGTGLTDGPALFVRPDQFPAEITDGELGALLFGMLAQHYERAVRERLQAEGSAA